MAEGYHIGAFVDVGLCSYRPPKHMHPNQIGHAKFYGQWSEATQHEYMIECEECKLVLLIIRANNLVPLFNSDQRKLAEEFKRIVGR